MQLRLKAWSKHFKYASAIALALAICGCSSGQPAPNWYPTDAPSPGDEQSRDDWHCVAGKDRLWNCKPAKLQVAPAESAEESPTQSRDPISPTDGEPPQNVNKSVGAAGTTDSFVLQLGAFRERDNAIKHAKTLAGVRGAIVPIQNDRGEWWAVIAGPYPERADAEAAAQDMTQANPDLNWWVRRMADLKGALVSAE